MADMKPGVERGLPGPARRPPEGGGGLAPTAAQRPPCKSREGKGGITVNHEMVKTLAHWAM